MKPSATTWLRSRLLLRGLGRRASAGYGRLARLLQLLELHLTLLHLLQHLLRSLYAGLIGWRGGLFLLGLSGGLFGILVGLGAAVVGRRVSISRLGLSLFRRSRSHVSRLGNSWLPGLGYIFRAGFCHQHDARERA